MDIASFYGKIGQIIVLDGELKISVNAKDYCLTRGDTLIISPLFIYEDFVESTDLKTEILALDMHMFLDQLNSFFHVVFPLYVLNHPVNHLSEDQLQMFEARFASINNNSLRFETSDIPTPLRNLFKASSSINSMGLLLELLVVVFERADIDDFQQHLDDENSDIKLLPQFLFSLNRNFRTERSVSFYANQANYSVGHFSSIIRRKTGRSPIYWITFITINNAKVLLKQKDLSIKEVARQLGFPEQFTFRKYFKQHAGMSPSGYRKTLRVVTETVIVTEIET